MTPALLDTSKVIVGASGSGKTVTAKDEVQQLLEQRRHVAIVDPTGVWWGLRSNAAGDGPGYDLPIFGGEHGDVPIRPTDGAAIARTIIEQRVSAIVDISGIDNSADWRRFMDDFVATLRKKPRGHFHLVLDEADEFAAQVVADDIGHRLRENLVWMAKRGRVQGFVPTYITQRTAEIAKAVISQVQTIVAHQLIAPTDQKSIDDYLKAHGDQPTRKEVMGSLAELEIGERWIYSPRLKILERGVTPALTTFDSSRTPAPGEQLVEPRTLAQLDVSAIRAALAPAEPIPDDIIPEDPIAAFKKGGVVGGMLTEREQRITELEAIVAAQAEELAELREVDAAFDRQVAGLAAIEELVAAVQNGVWRKPKSGTAPDLDRANLHFPDATSRIERSAPARFKHVPVAEGASSRAVSGIAPHPDDALPKLNLTARDAGALMLAVFPRNLKWDDILLALGRRPNSGDSRAARKALLDNDLMFVEGGSCFALPAELLLSQITAGSIPSPDGLLDLWVKKLRGPAGEMLASLVNHGPATSKDLADRLGKSPTSGWWRQGLKDLRGSNVVHDVAGRLEPHPFFKGEL